MVGLVKGRVSITACARSYFRVKYACLQNRDNKINKDNTRRD